MSLELFVINVEAGLGLDYGDSPATTETAELSTGLLQKTSGFVTIKTSVL